jgi:hypothetical protein
MADSWQFDDLPNTTSFTTKFVLDGSPILRVYHDYDGGWQFHGSPDDPATPDVARLVSLGSMIARDATLNELHDLPDGWRAFRTSAEKPWQRQKNNRFPTYAESGYYLEDAVWLAQYRDDVHPLSEALRGNLKVGTYVKLAFRFAAENAERRDKQTERMWVLVTHIDEDENYIGTLENEPRYSGTLTCGDTIHFYPLHVMEVLEESSA